MKQEILSKKLREEIEKITKDKEYFNQNYTLDKCPHDGDLSDCRNCSYGCDYFYFNNECLLRYSLDTTYPSLQISNIMVSGNNNEILSIQLTNKEEILCIIWQDLSKEHSIGIKYINDIDDVYTLSIILDILKSWLSNKINLMDIPEFINFVIGEGSESLWKDIIDNESLYKKLMNQDNEEISDTIAAILSNTSINKLNKLSQKHNLNIIIC